MSGIKYYQLKEDEELPDEFCAVKDVNGEPSEYTFYRPETENAKLQELCRDMLKTIQVMDEEWHSLTDFTTMAEAAETYDFDAENAPEYEKELQALGIEVPE